MKKFIILALTLLLILSGCKTSRKSDIPTEPQSTIENTEIEPNYTGLNDEDLLQYIEDSSYISLINELDTNEYYIDNVEAVYVSKEYIEESTYNSQKNIYFGYTSNDLEKQFSDSKYIFTLSDDGNTIVQQFEDYDDTYDKVLQNVLVGSGVILICVTVSAVSAGAGAVAISTIFAVSAKTATIAALSDGIISGVTAGIITGYQTNDYDEALKAAALAGSEGFKWGAFTGALIGGVAQSSTLKGNTLNGLSKNEAAKIQAESKYSNDVIKQFSRYDEYEVYKDAGLNSQMVDNKLALTQPIDRSFIDPKTGLTNEQLMISGKAPVDSAGNSYQLHHIGQKNDSTLAILSHEQHMGNGNNKKLHSMINTENPSSDPTWQKTRADFWKSFVNSE